MLVGSTVLLDGVKYAVQYVTSKGMLDLKSDSGDVQYGVDPATVTVAEAPAAAPTVGAYVLLDGVKYAVQYVTSKGMLDLKSDWGDVRYGVDPATVTVADTEAPARFFGWLRPA